MFVPILGLVGILCKNTCLIMLVIVCSVSTVASAGLRYAEILYQQSYILQIIAMMDLGVMLICLIVALGAIKDPTKQADMATKYLLNNPLKSLADFEKDAKTVGIVLGVLIAIFLFDLIFNGTRCAFP